MDSLLLLASGVLLAVLAVMAGSRFVGFGAQTPEDYEGLAPALDLRSALNGDILCEGVIYGPGGRVTSRFVADMKAEWSGNRCTLSEVFRYDSGRTQHREWSFTLGNDGRIRATAADVPGEGQGRQSGCAVQLRYRIRLPEEAGGHVLKVNDWMYLTANGTIINRSQFRKFGIKVAELVATMRRVPT